MLDQAKIRTMVLSISSFGPLAEAAIRAIVAEAERYAKESPPKIDLICTKNVPDPYLIRTAIQGIRSELEALR